MNSQLISSSLKKEHSNEIKQNKKHEKFVNIEQKLDELIDEIRNHHKLQMLYNEDFKLILSGFKYSLESINKNFEILFEKSESLDQ